MLSMNMLMGRDNSESSIDDTQFACFYYYSRLLGGGVTTVVRVTLTSLKNWNKRKQWILTYPVACAAGLCFFEDPSLPNNIQHRVCPMLAYAFVLCGFLHQPPYVIAYHRGWEEESQSAMKNNTFSTPRHVPNAEDLSATLDQEWRRVQCCGMSLWAMLYLQRVAHLFF